MWPLCRDRFSVAFRESDLNVIKTNFVIILTAYFDGVYLVLYTLLSNETHQIYEKRILFLHFINTFIRKINNIE